MLQMSETGSYRKILSVGKRTGEFLGAGSLPSQLQALPTMIVTVNDRSAIALIDSGCSKTVVLKGLVSDCMLFSDGESMVLANGKGVRLVLVKCG